MPRWASADIISIQSERGSFSSRILNPNFSWVQYVSNLYERRRTEHKMQNAFQYYSSFEFIHLGYDEIACLFLLEHLSRIAEAGKCRWCKRFWALKHRKHILMCAKLLSLHLLVNQYSHLNYTKAVQSVLFDYKLYWTYSIPRFT